MERSRSQRPKKGQFKDEKKRLISAAGITRKWGEKPNPRGREPRNKGGGNHSSEKKKDICGLKGLKSYQEGNLRVLSWDTFCLGKQSLSKESWWKKKFGRANGRRRLFSVCIRGEVE